MFVVAYEYLPNLKYVHKNLSKYRQQNANDVNVQMEDKPEARPAEQAWQSPHTCCRQTF